VLVIFFRVPPVDASYVVLLERDFPGFFLVLGVDFEGATDPGFALDFNEEGLEFRFGLGSFLRG